MVVGIKKRNWDGGGKKWILFSIFGGLVSSVASGIYQEVALGWTCLRVYTLTYCTNLVIFLRETVMFVNMVFALPKILTRDLFSQGTGTGNSG